MNKKDGIIEEKKLLAQLINNKKISLEDRARKYAIEQITLID